MNRNSVNPWISRFFLNALIGTIKTRPAAALMVTPILHLFTSVSPAISLDSVPADFTEATFGGYANVPGVSFIPPGVTLPSGQGLGTWSTGYIFIADTTLVPPGETVLGYYLDDGVTTLYMAEMFDTPVPFAANGDFLSLDLYFPFISPGFVGP